MDLGARTKLHHVPPGPPFVTRIHNTFINARYKLFTSNYCLASGLSIVFLTRWYTVNCRMGNLTRSTIRQDISKAKSWKHVPRPTRPRSCRRCAAALWCFPKSQCTVMTDHTSQRPQEKGRKKERQRAKGKRKRNEKENTSCVHFSPCSGLLPCIAFHVSSN